MSRARELEEKIYGPAKEFGAIDLREEPYMGCGDSRPYFPSLYLSGKSDPALMKLPTRGKALVDYKVKRRHVDESRDDGVPRYGADIEIQSIEHVDTPAEDDDDDEGSELSATMFLREFAGERERDGAGRFAAGRVPSPDDFAVAEQAGRQKRNTKIAAGAGMVIGGALGVKAAKAVGKLA